MAEAPDPRGQHFITCQRCEDNVQFYCRPCKIRLCVNCVSPHLETNAPDHNIVYYHKRFEATTKSLHDPQIMRTISCEYHAMFCIRYAGENQIYVSSHVSFDIKRFRTNGTLVNTLTPNSLAMYLAPYKDGVLYTGTGGIRLVNSQGDKLFLAITGLLKGIKFVQPDAIFVCNFISKVEKYNTGGKRLLEIEYNNHGEQMYGKLENISINGNEDICVSGYADEPDRYHVVTVVDKYGNYRFTYTPEPKGYDHPVDLCCDSCLHIIILSNTIHVIDKDGNFLRYLAYDGMKTPWSVTIDREDNLFVSEMLDEHLRMIKYLY